MKACMWCHRQLICTNVPLKNSCVIVPQNLFRNAQGGYVSCRTHVQCNPYNNDQGYTITDFARQFLSHFIHFMQMVLMFLWICPNDGKPWRKWRALSYHPQTAVKQGKVKRGKLEDMVYLWKWPKDLLNKYLNSHTFIFQNVHVFEKPLFCSLKLLTI